jgi:hypothetical protein
MRRAFLISRLRMWADQADVDGSVENPGCAGGVGHDECRLRIQMSAEMGVLG